MKEIRNGLFLMSLFFAIPNLLQAMTMLGEKTAWRYGIAYYMDSDDTHGTNMYQVFYELMEGDSIVDGVSYRKMAITNIGIDANSYLWDDNGEIFCSHLNSIYSEWEQWGEEIYSIVLLREEEGKVYIQRQSYLDWWNSFSGFPAEHPDTIYNDFCGGADQILYDFTLSAGDRYPMIGNVTVKSVEQVNTGDGVCRKLLTLSNDIQLLEGMGCVDCYGMLIGYQSVDKVYSPYGSYYYKGYSDCYYKDGIEHIGDNNFITYKWTLADISHEISFSIDNPSSPCPMYYDHSGRRLHDKPAKGIYIQNGRKFVVR